MVKPTVITHRVGDVDVDLENGVVRWHSGLAIDADGSPRAYAPIHSGLKPLDSLANAGREGRYWGLACDEATGVPFVQGEEDPCPGFYVSTTALCDRTKPVREPSRYVDSETVAYISVPRELVHSLGVRPGDLAWVRRGDRECGAIVGDIGPAGAIGEGSIALAKLLGLSGDAHHGGCSSGVEWFVFLGTASNPPWPRIGVAALAEAIKGQRGV